jgi:hypothetical protein
MSEAMVLGRIALTLLVLASLGCERFSREEREAMGLEHVTYFLEGTGAKPASARYVTENFPRKLLVLVPGDSTSLAAVVAKLALVATAVPDSIHLTSEFPTNCSPVAEDFAQRDPAAAPIILPDGRRIGAINALDVKGMNMVCMMVYYDRST